MITYRIVVKDSNGVSLGEFTTFRSLAFGKNLNNYGSCSFEVPIDDNKAKSLIVPRRYTIEVYRRLDDDPEGDLVWAGEQALRKGHLSSSNDNWVMVQCFDWFEQLYQRITAKEVQYDGIDAGQIAWDLIDTTQNDPSGFGDLGITEGSIPVSINRDRSYYNQNIGEAIVNLANVINGFDFEITNTKVFNTYAVKGTDKSSSVIFEFGKNITDVDITEDSIHMVNRSIVLGEASDTNELTRVDRNNAAFQNTYKLRESTTSEMQVSDVNTLSDKGDAVLRKYQLPLLTLDMTLLAGSSPSILDFSLGDLITIIIKKGLYDINSGYRVFGWEIQQGNSNEEKLKLILGDFTEYGT